MSYIYSPVYNLNNNMYSEDRKTWMSQEETRIAKYQHQHRGLSFQKLFLPPISDQKVNLLGRDNHIYKGSIPKIPEDQLPPEVDETSINEEYLYKEIEDMNFPPVPKQELLGPSRRIGGEYTTAKRIAFAPIYVECTKELEETLVLGKDGGIYKTKEITPSRAKLDELTNEMKRRDNKGRKTSSTGEYVKPRLVLFHINNKPLLCGKNKNTLVELPTTEMRNIMGLIKERNTEGKSEITTDTTNQNEMTVQFENDDESEKAKETEIESQINEEQSETDTECTEGKSKITTDTTNQNETTVQFENDGESEKAKETEIESQINEKQSEKDTEISVDINEQPSSDTEISVDINEQPSSDTEESSDVVETKETTEESDSETISKE